METKRTAAQTKAAIEAAYREKRSDLVGWAAAATRDAPEAEDLLQSAFLGALENLDALSAVENLGAWLFASLRNRVIDRWRARERRERLGQAEVSADTLAEIARAADLDPGEALADTELREALAEAIRALPAPQREAIEAQVLGGETFAELSARTGVGIDTLASRKRYAIRALSEALREWADE
jgi:RNA polymerase sigma factor (sigma-70 family)